MMLVLVFCKYAKLVLRDQILLKVTLNAGLAVGIGLKVSVIDHFFVVTDKL